MVLSGPGVVSVHAAEWPFWRGPSLNGVSAVGNPPVTWSESENIRWKVAVPHSGDSTPVVWGDKIFLQTAVPLDKEDAATGGAVGNDEQVPSGRYAFKLVCLDRETEARLWARTVVPHQGHHPTSSLSAQSPVTDAALVWANFGSRGGYCFDLEGNKVWDADLGLLTIVNGFGEGSSPALAGDALIVVADQEGDSKIYAFDKKTGKVLWEKDRDEANTWATPLPLQVGGSSQVVVSGEPAVRSCDAKTGAVVWQLDKSAPQISAPLVYVD